MFITGLLFSREKLFNKLKLYYDKHKWIVAVAVLLCLLVYIDIPETFYDVIVAPAFTFVCALVIGDKRVLKKLFRVTGKYSTYMWLTHSIFIFYLAQDLIYLFHTSLACWVMTLLVSIIVAAVLTWLEEGGVYCGHKISSGRRWQA